MSPSHCYDFGWTPCWRKNLDFLILVVFRPAIPVSHPETCANCGLETLTSVVAFFVGQPSVVTHSSEVSGTWILSRATATNSFFSSSYQFLALHYLTDSAKLAFAAARSYLKRRLIVFGEAWSGVETVTRTRSKSDVGLLCLPRGSQCVYDLFCRMRNTFLLLNRFCDRQFLRCSQQPY